MYCRLKATDIWFIDEKKVPYIKHIKFMYSIYMYS